MTLLKRMTLVIDGGTIVKPDRNAAEVIAWLLRRL